MAKMDSENSPSKTIKYIDLNIINLSIGFSDHKTEFRAPVT